MRRYETSEMGNVVLCLVSLVVALVFVIKINRNTY